MLGPDMPFFGGVCLETYATGGASELPLDTPYFGDQMSDVFMTFKIVVVVVIIVIIIYDRSFCKPAMNPLFVRVKRL